MSKKAWTTIPCWYISPHREGDTAIVKKLSLPHNRSVLFLAVESDCLHDKLCNELSFYALPQNIKVVFQLLLYLTYSCNGEVFQVTLENPDFFTMSPPIREDFSHGRLYCFVLDMSDNAQTFDTLECDDLCGNLSYAQMVSTLDTQSIDMDVFNLDCDLDEDIEVSSSAPVRADEMLNEAYNAFMRLQLVRKKATSLNYAMMVMRDKNNDLKSAFDWVDISRDKVILNRVDKKKVRELQGSMYVNGTQYAKGLSTLPDSIANVNLKTLEAAIGRITDSCTQGQGKALFFTVMSKLLNREWSKHKVMGKYNMQMIEDLKFLERLTKFTDDLCRGPETTEVDVRELLVFRYSLETLIDVDHPDNFNKMLIHRHVFIPKPRIDKVLSEIKANGRTQHLVFNLTNGECYCRTRWSDGECQGECQTAYSCFYNTCELHPFEVTRKEFSYYFAHLYPHLARLERLSKEMKVKYGEHRQFESIVDMVFSILTRCCKDSLYDGLSELLEEDKPNSSLSMGRKGLADIHEHFYLSPGNEDHQVYTLHPLKVYDHALVRYLYCDTLQVGRLFQASTTFNYIITNTAPRYTIERIMLFNITGPGEGKSYANMVLNYQFSRVQDCIETLTSFTPQAFKYKEKRTSCVLFIDDAHLCYDKNTRGQDQECTVLSNTFKNLLDTSTLESDVVSKDAASSKMDTVKHVAVHNCGFVWNGNTLAFVSSAWGTRCFIMETEYPERLTRTRSTKQIRDAVEKHNMEHIAVVCLYRQNLIQSATMIADSDFMQFGKRFDAARTAHIAAYIASHIVYSDAGNLRVPLCINQLVYAEALKLACHFIFDIWIPPWTEIPNIEDYPELMCYMKQLNLNRMKALDKLSFGQICLETNAVYKLCTAACLPDICPRVMDNQARFACQTLGYLLTQIYAQNLKSSVRDGDLYITGIDTMFFSKINANAGNMCAHELLRLCSGCKFPARLGQNHTGKSYTLCKCKFTPNNNLAFNRKVNMTNTHKKVASVQIPLEAVYDLLAIYAPNSHMFFWEQLSKAMLVAYVNRDFEQGNAFGQCVNDSGQSESSHILTFTLDLNQDPICSLILEGTAAIDPLNELKFNKCFVGGELYQCSAPLYYGGVLVNKIPDAPSEAYNDHHLSESKQGTRGTFHGPRLSVYSKDYPGLPIKNASSFCTTRTVYNQDQIILTLGNNERSYLFELEEDWEWKDATQVLNTVHGDDVFSVPMLKRDYAATIMMVKGELMTMRPQESTLLSALLEHFDTFDGEMALDLRKGVNYRKKKHRLRELSRTENRAAEIGSPQMKKTCM